MTTYSFSRINTFLQCPYAYYLSYVLKEESLPSPYTEHGSWVHKQLEDIPNHDPEAQVFVDALGRYLDKTSDKIIENEKYIEFELDGVKFRGYVDAITEKGYIIDYKITSSPSYYGGKVGYQLPMYKLALTDGQPKYLLFRVVGKDRDFDKLLTQEVQLTEELLEKKRAYILRSVEMIEMCEKDGVFPPSYGNCRTCFYRHKCPYYSG